MKEAREVNPDSVRFLKIGNNNLREFPMEILIYKNLYELNFESANIAETYLNERWLLTKSEKEEYFKIFNKQPGARTDRGRDLFYPTHNRNKIKKIPNEISQLKKLSLLILDHYHISKRELKKIRFLLPNCEIIYR